MSTRIDHEQEYKRALIFLERKTKIHITRANGLFHNGILLEVSKNFFIIKDHVSGKEEFILFEELSEPIEKYKEAGDGL